MTTTTKTKAAPAATIVEETFAATKATVENAVKTGQDAMAKNMETAFAMTREQFEKAGGNLFHGFDDVAAFGKDNMDALVKASTIATKGWQDLGAAWFAFAQGTMEKSVATAQAMMTVKSPRELADLQNSFAKASFDSFVAESSKLSEMGVKVTNDAFAPITARVNATVEKFGKPLAA
ncbi:MAG: phasin family protein [Inquilinus sp.]|nr:phasin family protein [Inquilinus sp.]